MVLVGEGEFSALPPLEIQTTPAQGHLPLPLALEPIRAVTTPDVAARFETFIEEITYQINFELAPMLHAEFALLCHMDQNTSINELDN